jgi:arylsulfatase A-like enzyme
VAASLLVACLFVRPLPTPSAVAGEAGRRPNVLLIVTDDQAWTHFSRVLMPSVYARIVDRGALFTRAYASTSVCCPSRAEMFTGLYAHHTNVDGNLIPLERPTIAMALHDAGYRTMMAGKYLNSWTTCAPRPEFDRWACLGTPAPSTYSQIDPWINVDGRLTHFTGYQTDILADQVTSFIAETPPGRPFFAIYAPTSPHSPADDPRYDTMPVTVPRSPSWDVETRTPTAPEYMRRFPLGAGLIGGTDRHFRNQARSTRALDDAVGSLLDGLGDRADDTLVLYISDNGYEFGDHRRVGKNDAFEEATRVPMVARYPSVLPPGGAFSTSRLVANIDVAPTIADAAGLPWGADGVSLLPLLRGDPQPVHDAVLLERCRGDHVVADPCSGFRFEGETVYPPGYEGVVTRRHKYVEYTNGDRQLFDLQADPYELVNLADDPASSSVRRELAATLRAMRSPPPVDTTLVTGPTGTLRTRAAEFTFFSQTRFATYRCRLLRGGVPDPWHDCSSGTDVVGGLADGDYEFEVAGTDETGATDATPASRAFHVVTTDGPDVSIVEGPPDVQRGGGAAFRFVSQTEGALFRCRIARWGGTGTWRACNSGAASYDGLDHGVWRFDVRAIDPASGERSRPPDTGLVRVDTLGPTFVAAERPPRITSSRRANFVFVPREETTGSWTCSIDGADGVDCSDGRVGLVRLSRGSHTVSISARDLLGNVRSTVITWVVDRTPPTVRIAEGPPALSDADSATFRFTSNEAPAEFACVVDAYPEMPCSATWRLPAMSAGTHVLTATSIDRALNRSRPQTWRWRST